MVQGASLFYLAKGLYRRDFFPTRLIFRGFWLQAYFRLIGKENPGHIAEAQAASLAFIAGHRSRDRGGGRGDLRRVDRPADLAGHPGHRPAAPRRRSSGLAGHRRTGRRWRGSSPPGWASPERWVRRPTRGRRLHRPPRRRSAARSGQGQAVRRLAERHGFDLARCYAYSDSHNDLPLLSLVGHPCAVNPDASCWRTPRTGLAGPRLPHRASAVRVGALGAGTLAPPPAWWWPGWPSGATSG